ncbi:MAG: hypothetical protein KAH30_03300 [Caldisericia bacterium]|nr:hypothetical protein [Caldisericia bacterium]
MYWDYNEDELYGLNTKTGEKTWQIQQDILFKEEGLLQDNEISAVYSDNRGVLVYVRSKCYDEVSKELKFKCTLQCFREKKE